MGAAFSTWGGAGPGARAIINKIQKIASNGLGQKARSEKCTAISRKISMALAKGMAAQLRARDRVLDDLRGGLGEDGDSSEAGSESPPSH